MNRMTITALVAAFLMAGCASSGDTNRADEPAPTPQTQEQPQEQPTDAPGEMNPDPASPQAGAAPSGESPEMLEADPAAGQDSVSGAELDAFASVLSEFRTIEEEIQLEAQRVTTQQELQTLQQEAQSRMNHAVQESSLDPQRFQEIAVKIEQDQETRSKLNDRLRELGESPIPTSAM